MLHNLSINIQCIKCINLLAVFSCFLACSILECNLFVIARVSAVGCFIVVIGMYECDELNIAKKLNNVFTYKENDVE